jgi:hypothetical protein
MPALNASRVAAAIEFNNEHALEVLESLCSVLKVQSPQRQYDAALVQLIAEKQGASGLEVDGKVGQHTRELLSTLQPPLPAGVLWPAPELTDVAKAEHYRAVCANLGFETNLQRPLLVAFRGVELRGAETHPVKTLRKYDDAFVLLALVEGAARAREFVGATHPYQTTTSAQGTPDVNNDGARDVGTIKPGHYLLKRQAKPPGHPPSLHLVKLDGKEGIPTWRDVNHDGKIAGAELEPSLLATEVLLHPGFTSLQKGKAIPYSSIGCQTAKVEDVQAVAEHALVDYLLVDARAAILTLGAVATPATLIS